MNSYEYDSRGIKQETESAAGRRKASNIKDMIRKVEQEIKSNHSQNGIFEDIKTNCMIRLRDIDQSVSIRTAVVV